MPDTEQASSDDVVIRCRLETTQVEQSQKKISDGFRDMGLVGKFAMSVLGATAAGLSAPIAQDLFTIGRGLTAPIGRAASRNLGLSGAAAQIGAQEQAIEDVANIFGAAGPQGVRSARAGVESAYKAFLGLRERQAMGEVAVKEILDPKTKSGEVLEKAINSLSNMIYDLIMTAKDLKGRMSGGGR
jgi:hypothetical protein